MENEEAENATCLNETKSHKQGKTIKFVKNKSKSEEKQKNVRKDKLSRVRKHLQDRLNSKLNFFRSLKPGMMLGPTPRKHASGKLLKWPQDELRKEVETQ